MEFKVHEHPSEPDYDIQCLKCHQVIYGEYHKVRFCGDIVTVEGPQKILDKIEEELESLKKTWILLPHYGLCPSCYDLESQNRK